MAARLLTPVSHPKAAACVKGRFFDRLDGKLNQLARFDNNELVSIDLQAMATACFGDEKRRCDVKPARRHRKLRAMLRAARRRLFMTFVLGQNRPIEAVTLCRFGLD